MVVLILQTTIRYASSTELYHQAMLSIEDEYYNEAIKNFEILVEEHAVLFGNSCSLKMGEIYILSRANGRIRNQLQTVSPVK